MTHRACPVSPIVIFYKASLFALSPRRPPHPPRRPDARPSCCPRRLPFLSSSTPALSLPDPRSPDLSHLNISTSDYQRYKTDMEVDSSFRLPTMPPPSGAPFRALHPYQFAPAEYNPLMPSPDHPPNAAPHPPPARSEHSGPSEPHDRNHSPHNYYSHPPPPPAHASTSRIHYQSPPSPQFRTHAVNWGLPPIASSQQQQQQHLPPPSQLACPSMPSTQFPPPATTPRRSSDDAQRAPQAAMLYAQSQQLPPIQANQAGIPPATRARSSPVIAAASSFTQGANVPRLPPIMQVEKQQVTTSATQAASASRRRNEANFVCPVPGCGSTFTRRFNLRGHLRSHTAERPFLCEWPGCNKGFARQHDCKRHQALHTSRSQSNVCQGCGKTFSRLDALNRHLRSDGGADCRQATEAANVANRLSPLDDEWENASNSTERSERGGSRRSPQRSATR
ncbi:hypothetical protein LXA43DRAFT_158649 [Ganoderma leucocontextum]|nr:hypothetical protein LXA43DRAFT_158649 [Ganoderma leucocontextum]